MVIIYHWANYKQWVQGLREWLHLWKRAKMRLEQRVCRGAVQLYVWNQAYTWKMGALLVLDVGYALHRNKGIKCIQISTFLIYVIFLLFILLQLSQFPSFPFYSPPPSPPLLTTVNPLSVFPVHESFIQVLWLVPSPSFHHSPSPSSPPTVVSLFHVSMSLVLFFLLVYFVHYIPVISEVIWYLSFTNWLISHSLMVSSSIHAVTKGRSSFFLLHSIPLCKCTTVFWSIYLLMDT